MEMGIIKMTTTITQANIVGSIELELAFNEGLYLNQDLIADTQVVATAVNKPPFYKLHALNLWDYDLETNEAQTAHKLHMVVSVDSDADINADNFAKKINIRDMLGNTHTCEILNVKIDWDIDSLVD